MLLFLSFQQIPFILNFGNIKDEMPVLLMLHDIDRIHKYGMKTDIPLFDKGSSGTTLGMLLLLLTVMNELKNEHIGGAFSKNNRCACTLFIRNYRYDHIWH